MRKLTVLTTLILSLTIFSSTSFAEWMKVIESVNGTTFYVDFERIRKVDGYVYFWWLSESLKPDEYGDLSYKKYSQVDCKFFRFRSLSVSYHKEPMGEGTGESFTPSGKWTYPPPKSSGEEIIKRVCAYEN